MWKSLKPATAIALALGVGACTSIEGPFSVLPGPRDQFTNASLVPDKEDISNEMRLADAAQAAGDKATAIAIYRKLAREYPFALKPRLALGDALLAAKAPQEAERAYEGALKLKPNSHQALTGLGRVELALHKPAEALHYFERAVKAKPGDTEARNGQAVALDQLGDHARAQAIYLDLLARDSTNLRVRNNYALSLALAGKYDESADILSGLAAAPDAETKVRQNLALVYGLAGNEGQAAHVARMDLDEDAVSNNLRYYQRLRNTPSPVEKGAALLNPTSHTAPLAPVTEKPSTADAQPVQPAQVASAPALEPREEWSERKSSASAPRQAPQVASLDRAPVVSSKAGATQAQAPEITRATRPATSTQSAPKTAEIAVAAPLVTKEVAALPAHPAAEAAPASQKTEAPSLFGKKKSKRGSGPAPEPIPAGPQPKVQTASIEPTAAPKPAPVKAAKPLQPVETPLTAQDLLPKVPQTVIAKAKAVVAGAKTGSLPAKPATKPVSAPAKTDVAAASAKPSNLSAKAETKPAAAPEKKAIAASASAGPISASVEPASGPAAAPWKAKAEIARVKGPAVPAVAPVSAKEAALLEQGLDAVPLPETQSHGASDTRIPTGKTSATHAQPVSKEALPAAARKPAVPAVAPIAQGEGISGAIRKPRLPAVPVAGKNDTHSLTFMLRKSAVSPDKG